MGTTSRVRLRTMTVSAVLAVVALSATSGVADAAVRSVPHAPAAAGAASRDASDATDATGLPVADRPDPGSYRALPPARLVDTRATGGRLGRGGRLVVPVLGRQGVPETGVGAVQLHVTAVGASRASHLTVHPSGTSPSTSSLNYEATRPVANTVTARPGADGSVVVTNGAAGVDVVVDLVGWFALAPGASAEGVHAIAPVRVWDSRVAGRTVTVSGTSVTVVGGAVPSTAGSVVVNLTTVGASASGLPLLSWAAGTTRPATSNGNTVRGAAVATQVVVGVGSGGRISVATVGGSTHLVVDVVGYVVGPPLSGAGIDGGLRTVAPLRLVDTRTTGTPLSSGQRLVQRVAGRGGVPTGSSAALLTITSVPGAGATGTLVAVGNGERRPPTSDLNARADVPVARQVLTPLGVDGGIAVIRSGGSGHVVVDLVGYVTRVPPPTVIRPSGTLLAGGGLDDGLGPQAAQVLRTAVRHGLATWWLDTAPALMARPMDAAAQSDRTDAVRRLSMEALAVSTALATGLHDPRDSGMTDGEAVGVVRDVVSRVACRHRGTVVGGWGQSWQSTLWSSLAARAAWLSWDAMPASARACVRAMVVSEADFTTTLRPLVMVSSSGVLLRPGNTAAEENAWQALAPAVAVAMMPAAERRDAWRGAQVRLLAASWTRAEHLEQDIVLDGQRLVDLVPGWNVEADGSIVNHDRIAPDYSTNAYQNVDALLVATLAGHRAPEAALHGVREVYAALATNRYAVADGYAHPGGTVYDPIPGGIPLTPFGVYYPQGCDWGEGQVLPYALLDAQAAAFGFGGRAGTPTDAGDAAVRHLDETVRMQERSADGRTYADPTEYTYVGREEHTAQLAAQLVLTLVLADAGVTADAVAPAGVDVAPDEVLRTPPAPSDESRLIDPSATSG